MGVIWHDLECGAYRADLELWRELADEMPPPPTPVLDVGAGTGRVALDLARRGHDVTALDADEELLGELAQRAQTAGLAVTTLNADARDFTLAAPVALIIVPMQTIQLLGGPDGRAAFLRCAHAALRPGGLLVAALADALEGFDEEHSEPPLPDLRQRRDGTIHSSRVVAVQPEATGTVIARIRETVTPDGRRTAEGDEILLEHAGAATVAAEAGRLGLFTPLPPRAIGPTDEHVGSEVVVLCRS